MSTEAQWQAVKGIYTEGLGFEPTDAMIDHAVDGLSPGSMPSASLFSQWLIYADPLEVGKAARADERKKADAFYGIYREVLGREPDAKGLAYWRGVYADGLPLSEIIRHVENSREAQSE